MKTIILHIGSPKTGTSSLQQFFFENRAKLKESDVVFPIFSPLLFSGLMINGTFLRYYCSSLVSTDNYNLYLGDAKKNLEKLKYIIDNSKRILLTDECLFDIFPIIKGSDFPKRVDKFWDEIARLLYMLGVNIVRVVVYLRRQDDFIISLWKEHVKYGATGLSFADYCMTPQSKYLLDYASLLETIKRAFGSSGEIVVRRYDRASFAGGDIYHDFCEAAGIAWNDRFVLPKTEANPSLSFDVAEAIRGFYGNVPSGTYQWSRILARKARQLSCSCPDLPGTSLFSSEDAHNFVASYAKGNQYISESYMGGEPLFSKKYDALTIWQPNEQRITEYTRALKRALAHHPNLNFLYPILWKTKYRLIHFIPRLMKPLNGL